jgi:hypothetical protein
MIKSFHILLVICLLLATSCTSSILRIAGLRKPKVETKQSVIKFLKKLNEDTNDIYTLDTTLFQELQKSHFKPGMAAGFRPVQIRVYDKQGEPVMHWASCEGSLSCLHIFDTVPPRVVNGLDTSLTLKEDLSCYYTLDGQQAQIAVEKGYDYYFIIYFAKYFPKLSKESFEEVYGYKRKYPEIKCKIYKINVDIQEFWNVDLQFDLNARIGGEKK